MSQAYQVVTPQDRQELSDFLAKDGQRVLPMLELVMGAGLSLDQLIDVTGRAAVEAVLKLSAQEVAGVQHPGKASGQIRWHGQQQGVVTLGQHKLRVTKPRLRQKGPDAQEVAIPAYQSLQQDPHLAKRMMAILLKCVSTRKYRQVIRNMADMLGVSKSQVSREFIAASSQALQELAQRRFDDLDMLVIYIDGLIFGKHHVLGALGIDSQGYKHMLGIVEGASENAAAVKVLLENLVERGIAPGRRRLFVIDGSKALRAGIDAVYGADNPVQRCRLHKIRNVVDQLPQHLREQTKAVMKAAYRLEPSQGMAQLEQQALWLDKLHPTAAASLREGLKETFTINRIGLPGELRRCLGSTNIIESPNGGVRARTNRVCRWRDGHMVLRWAACSFLDAEENFKRLHGFSLLWILKSYLDHAQSEQHKIAM